VILAGPAVAGAAFVSPAGPLVSCLATTICDELDAVAAAEAVALGVTAAGGRPLATALEAGSRLPATLSASDLCIVAGGRIHDRSSDRRLWGPAVTASVTAGVPCVVLGDRIDRETAYRLLRMGVRGVTPLGHPQRTSARWRLELVREARIAAVQALDAWKIPNARNGRCASATRPT
jgi:hypothetical protein